MARRKVELYTFTPGASNSGTIKMPGNFTLDDILMITNVTRNTVIYNFSDPTLGATVTNVISTTTAQPTCTIVLNYNTAAHSSTDKISILVDFPKGIISFSQ